LEKSFVKKFCIQKSKRKKKHCSPAELAAAAAGGERPGVVPAAVVAPP
jgi:hypothetical protein